MPLLATITNPRGQQPHRKLHFAAGHAEMSRVNTETTVMKAEWSPQGRHCVDAVFEHFEQCYLRQ